MNNQEKMDTARDKMDVFIHEYLTSFIENNLFKTSAQNWINTGRPSGPFRAALYAMMDEYMNSELTSLRQENERLRNDLADMTDVKQGRGPTALSNCIQEIADLRQEIKERDREIEALRMISKDNARIHENEIKEKDQEIERLSKELGACATLYSEHLEARIKGNETISDLRSALREAVDRLDRSSKTIYHCAAIFQKVSIEEPIPPLTMAQDGISKTLDRCRKLLGD